MVLTSGHRLGGPFLVERIPDSFTSVPDLAKFDLRELLVV